MRARVVDQLDGEVDLRRTCVSGREVGEALCDRVRYSLVVRPDVESDAVEVVLEGHAVAARALPGIL